MAATGVGSSPVLFGDTKSLLSPRGSAPLQPIMFDIDLQLDQFNHNVPAINHTKASPTPFLLPKSASYESCGTDQQSLRSPSISDRPMLLLPPGSPGFGSPLRMLSAAASAASSAQASPLLRLQDQGYRNIPHNALQMTRLAEQLTREMNGVAPKPVTYRLEQECNDIAAEGSGTDLTSADIAELCPKIRRVVCAAASSAESTHASSEASIFVQATPLVAPAVPLGRRRSQPTAPPVLSAAQLRNVWTRDVNEYREKNRIAAKQSRERKIKFIKSLEKSCAKLEADARGLRSDIAINRDALCRLTKRLATGVNVGTAIAGAAGDASAVGSTRVAQRLCSLAVHHGL